MKLVEAILVAAMAIALSGCVVGGKQQTAKATPLPPAPVAPAPAPLPPPQPLSDPQTHVELPAPQPISEEARLTTETPGEPAPPPPASSRKPARPARQGTSTPKPETPPPAAPAAAAPTVTPTEPPREPIQEIVTPEVQSQLQKQAEENRKNVSVLLSQVSKRRLAQEKTLVNNIESFVKLSIQAEGEKDMRKANELSGRALILAKELRGVK